MAESNPLLQVIDGLYGATLDPSRWSDALHGLADYMGSHSAHLFIVDSNSKARFFAAVSKRFPVEGLDAFHAHYHTIDPRIRAGWHKPVGVMLPDTELCDPELFEKSEFYNDFYRHYDVRWMAGTMLERTDTATIGFAVVRTPEEGHFDAPDIEKLELLQPHLTNAALISQRFTALEGRAATQAEAFDQLTAGIVTLDRRGRPVLVNRVAQGILAQNDGLSLGMEGLQVAAHNARAPLAEAVGAALREAASGALAIPRPSLRRPFELLIAPLLAHVLPQGDGPGGALLIVTDPERVPEPPAALLVRLYGLTPAEAQVAAALAAGRTLKEIAETAGTTRHAARWHLKQIFQKTATKRQAELVKLLRAGPLVLARGDKDG